MNLRAKLILTVTIIMFISLCILIIWNINQQKSQMMRRLEEVSSTMNSTIRKSLYNAMLENKREDIQKILEAVGKLEGVKQIRILDESAKVHFSDNAKLIGIDDPEKLPLIKESFKTGRGSGSYTSQDEESNYVRLEPILNLPECRTCHGEKNKYLGFLSIDLSPGWLVRDIYRNLYLTLVFSFSAVLFTGIIFMFLLNSIIYKPVAELSRTMEKVDTGDMNARSKILTNDELGKLAENFNEMLAHIQQSNEQIRQMQAKLLQVQKLAAMGRLTASLAHEMNTPLTSILTCVDQLREKELAEKASKRYLEIIRNEILRIYEIEKKLGSFSPAYEEQPEEIDIKEMLTEIAELVKPGAENQNVKLMLSLSPDLPPVLGSSNQIRQVFMNMISNALYAMPQGGELKIEALEEKIAPEIKKEENIPSVEKDRFTAEISKISPATENFVKIKFSDAGTGIPPENIDKIFDPFFTTKDVGEGMGLGLSISYHIVRGHQGDIKVESQPGKGTTFTVMLPAFRRETKWTN